LHDLFGLYCKGRFELWMLRGDKMSIELPKAAASFSQVAKRMRLYRKRAVISRAIPDVGLSWEFAS
jgi:hypothetical protein